jgi:DNA-binding transcriptional MerR regulator
MVPMPVATLRIWEQRYQAVRPRALPSGHRRYTVSDVERLRCLRQLVVQGHAIGAIARLDTQQLQQLAQRMSGVQGPRPVMVVGAALGTRLMRSSTMPARVHVAAIWEALPDAASLASAAGCDVLVLQMAGLHGVVPAELQALRAALPALQVAVVYRYASAPALAAFAAAGFMLLRDTAEDGQLAGQLAALPSTQPAPPQAALPSRSAVAPRRYDDAALAAIVGMRQSVLCECPRHIAELLLQLNQFEAYSAACRNDSPADAALHGHLQQVAAASRSLFEEALASVIAHGSLPQA